MAVPVPLPFSDAGGLGADFSVVSRHNKIAWYVKLHNTLLDDDAPAGLTVSPNPHPFNIEWSRNRLNHVYNRQMHLRAAMRDRVLWLLFRPTNAEAGTPAGVNVADGAIQLHEDRSSPPIFRSDPRYEAMDVVIHANTVAARLCATAEMGKLHTGIHFFLLKNDKRVVHDVRVSFRYTTTHDMPVRFKTSVRVTSYMCTDPFDLVLPDDADDIPTMLENKQAADVVEGEDEDEDNADADIDEGVVHNEEFHPNALD